MRSAEQFHGHQVEKLAGALQRPGMCCGHGRYADFYFSNLLSDLCWLDERETAFAKVVQELLTGCMRVYGRFLFQMCPDFARPPDKLLPYSPGWPDRM